jgi:tRNA threonylcarbamoyladenosine biosynthesis protein TsaB
MFAAIETATDSGSIALGSGAAVIAEVVIGARTRHAEALLPALDFMLRTAGLARRDIAGVVVGAGPGSFTGVRVAAATARGLAHGLGVPLYAYSSLAALAVAAGVTGRVCPLFDARRGEVYAACYDVDAAGAVREVMTPAALSTAELLERMRGEDAVYVGEGAERYAAALGIAPRAGLAPRASALLRLAAADGAGAGLVSGAAWEPSYLRASGAERGIAG